MNLKGKNLHEPEQIGFLDLLIVFLKKKTLILKITLGAFLLSFIISFLLPAIYRAESKILPPQQSKSGMASQLMNQLEGFAGLIGGAFPLRTPNELYVEMLKSRTVLDRIVKRFDLMKVYKKKYREDARRKLLKVLTAEEEKKSGIVSVEVEDKDPQRAADMANAFVEELMLLSSNLAISEAAQRRLFFEEQLKEEKGALVFAEESIRDFQEKTGALQIDSQAKVMIEGIAKLRAEIAAKTVQRNVLRTYAKPQNPDLQTVEEELHWLRAELRKLESGRKKGHDPLMPTGRMPSVGIEYFRKLRDMKYHEAIYELLLKQYEIAKLDEASDSSVIQVIDIAYPPDKKVKPKRAFIIIISTLIGFLVSLFAVYIIERVENKSSNPDYMERIQQLRLYANLVKNKK